MNTSDPSLPNYVHPAAVAIRPDLDLVADLLAGTRRIWERAQAAKYLRKWKDEAQEVYDIRRESETVFEGLARVLSACVGMLFAKPPAVVWNQSEVAMREHWQNVDGMGTAGPVLAKRFSDQSLRDGVGLLFVDHPVAPTGTVVTEETELALGLRPRWALYQRTQLCSWRTATINNTLRLTQLVLEECTPQPAGLYGVTTVKYYRVLWLRPKANGGYFAGWTLFEETTAAGLKGFREIGTGVFVNRAGQTRDTLPVGIAYTGRTDALCCATIPLLGVAWANLAHWRKATALSFAEDVAAYAQGVLTGELASTTAQVNGAPVTIPGRVKLGPLALIHVKGENASFDWKAPPTEAFAPLERAIQEKLQQIGQMGLQFMVTDTRAAETATAKRLDATAENSTLATAAQGIQDAWNTGLELHAWYLGIKKAGAPVMTINTDFDAVALDPATMAVYVQAVAQAGLPPRLLLEAWQRGGRIPADTDLDLLESEMMANAQAAADHREADAAMRMDALAAA